MRVLHVNKFRRVTGGVETYLHGLIASQRALGLDVDLFTSEDGHECHFSGSPSSIQDVLRGGATLIWSRAAAAGLRERIVAFNPDVVHFHSIYHQLSPSVIRAAATSGVPTVMTLHDYKLAAPCYVLHRNGGQCFDCVGRRFPAPAIRHKCVKGSRMASLLCAMEHLLHRQVYRSGIDRFLAPSEFARDVFTAANAVPRERVVVVPLGVGVPVRSASPEASATVLYFGRLAAEKNVGMLLDAWVKAALPAPWRFVIAGDGPQRRALEARRVAGVEFVGQLFGDRLVGAIEDAALVAVPSASPETFGLSAAEAMAAGVPVVVSGAGNLPALIGDCGEVLYQGGADEWAGAFRRLASTPAHRRALGLQARRRIETMFSTTAALVRVVQCYEDVIGRPSIAQVAHAVA